MCLILVQVMHADTAELESTELSHHDVAEVIGAFANIVYGISTTDQLLVATIPDHRTPVPGRPEAWRKLLVSVCIRPQEGTPWTAAEGDEEFIEAVREHSRTTFGW
jgi:hypothetical protein